MCRDTEVAFRSDSVGQKGGTKGSDSLEVRRTFNVSTSNLI